MQKMDSCERYCVKGIIEMIKLNFPRGNSALITFGSSYRRSCKRAFIVFQHVFAKKNKIIIAFLFKMVPRVN